MTQEQRSLEYELASRREITKLAAALAAAASREAAAKSERDAERERKHDALSQLASLADLLNTWARECGVQEARNESAIKFVINGLWSDASDTTRRLTETRAERDAALKLVGELREALTAAKNELFLAFTQNFNCLNGSAEQTCKLGYVAATSALARSEAAQPVDKP